MRDGDIEAVRGLFAEDATWEYPGDLPLSRTWRGRDVIVGVFAVRDGKITSVREYTDTQHVEHVLFGQR